MATYVTAGSRAGIGSPVITDGGTGNTYMVSGLGAEKDSVNANITLTGVSTTSSIGTATAIIAPYGYASVSLNLFSTGNAGANSIYLSQLIPISNASVDAVLMNVPSSASGLSFKVLIYDGTPSALLATGYIVTAVAAGYNRFPLTTTLNVTGGTTYYVGYVCANSLGVSIEMSGGLTIAYFVSGGASVSNPANPISGGTGQTNYLANAIEFSTTSSQTFGWGPDHTNNLALSASNTVATLSSTGSRAARSVITHDKPSAVKKYAEVTVSGGSVGSTSTGIGVVSANWLITSNTTFFFAEAWAPNGGIAGTTAVSSGVTYTVNDILSIAYDSNLQKVWFRKNGGSWIGNGASPDPATGTSGIAVNPGNWPVMIVAGDNGTATPVFALADYSSTFTYTLPSGFSAWSDFVASNVTLTGVAGTTAVGDPTLAVNTSITGVVTTSAVGTPIVLTEVDIAVTGVSSTSAIGTPTVELDASITLIGVAATSAVGDPTINIDDAALIGQAATAAVGTSTIKIDTSVTGVASTSAVGDPTTDVFFPVFVTGVVATPLVGLLLGTGAPITGVATVSAIGTPSVAIIDGAIIDGVASTVTLGTLALQEDNNPSIVGVQTNLGMGTIHAVVEPVVTGVAATSALGVPIPTNLQLASFSLQIGLGIIATTVDNAVVVGVQSRAQAGVPLAISTGNRISVAVTGLTATPAIGTLVGEIGTAIIGVETDSAIADVTVGIAVTSALTMTDIQIETILDLRDDFSVTLRWSDTDGYSWSDSAIRSIGQTGNYLCNPQWRRLGMSRRGRVYELSWSCPQATALQGATIMYQDAST